MSNILTRTITGSVFISVVLFPLFLSNIAVACVFGLFMTVALIEFYQLFKKHESVNVSWEFGLFFGLLMFGIFTLIAFGMLPSFMYLFLIPLFFGLLLIELWRNKGNSVLNASVLSLGIVYVVVPFSLMIHIGMLEDYSFPLLAGMFMIIWMNDTFAYLCGRLLGKHKLIERVSPNKTWEGMIGGILFAILSGYLIAVLFDPERLVFWVASGAIIAPFSVLGDLLESLFKRSANVKDSSNILPGHGGVLDRFDGTLLTVPFFLIWVYLYLFI